MLKVVDLASIRSQSTKTLGLFLRVFVVFKIVGKRLTMIVSEVKRFDLKTTLGSDLLPNRRLVMLLVKNRKVTTFFFLSHRSIGGRNNNLAVNA